MLAKVFIISLCFRLVIDRETGKPKGYGFCEYKDEETALSARRNLQGYEINGRQLRVDFAENDKNADRNREQVLQSFDVQLFDLFVSFFPFEVMSLGCPCMARLMPMVKLFSCIL